jgi:glyoxylase-like metal-dependent hydrolase (beta-lactamase superfamily II)
MIELLDGVYSWSWLSPEKGFNFNGHLLKAPHGVVMVDPPELTAGDISFLDSAGLTPNALIITNRNHLRSREAILARWKVPVVMHEAEVEQAGVPCDWEVEGEDDVYGLKIVHLPGKSPGEIALFWAERRILLVGDALIAPKGAVKLVPDDKMDDPALLRRSLKKLASLDFDVLLVGDGDPILSGAKAAASSFL